MPDYADTELDLSDLESCYHFVRVSLEPFGLEPSRDTRLKLGLEAGRQGEVTVYRPWLRLSRLLARAKNEAHLNEGEGAKFRDADKTISGWLEEQAQADAALGLTLPASPSTGLPSRGSYAVRTVTDWG